MLLRSGRLRMPGLEGTVGYTVCRSIVDEYANIDVKLS